MSVVSVFSGLEINLELKDEKRFLGEYRAELFIDDNHPSGIGLMHSVAESPRNIVINKSSITLCENDEVEFLTFDSPGDGFNVGDIFHCILEYCRDNGRNPDHHPLFEGLEYNETIQHEDGVGAYIIHWGS